MKIAFTDANDCGQRHPAPAPHASVGLPLDLFARERLDALYRKRGHAEAELCEETRLPRKAVQTPKAFEPPYDEL